MTDQINAVPNPKKIGIKMTSLNFRHRNESHGAASERAIKNKGILGVMGMGTYSGSREGTTN